MVVIGGHAIGGLSESMALVSMVEAFSQYLPPSIVCSCMIYNSLEDWMVMLPNQIERLVHPPLLGSETVDHAEGGVITLVVCSVASGNPEVTVFVRANKFISSAFSNNCTRGSNLPKKFVMPL